MSNDDILHRWRNRLEVRLDLERKAKIRRAAVVRALDNARKGGRHPREGLVQASDLADAVVHRRMAQVREARRVIARHSRSPVSAPVDPILADSWGFHPGVHDGVDVMALYKDDVVAMCDGDIVRVSASGWWGKGARPTNGHPVSDGDGIIILRCTINSGPFKPGLLIGYGHAEGATVRVGQHVVAGQTIGHVGWANGAHIHLMIRGADKTPEFIEGVGDRDPRPYLDYAVKNGH